MCAERAASRLAENASWGFGRFTMPEFFNAVFRQNSMARTGSTCFVVSTTVSAFAGGDTHHSWSRSRGTRGRRPTHARSGASHRADVASVIVRRRNNIR